MDGIFTCMGLRLFPVWKIVEVLTLIFLHNIILHVDVFFFFKNHKTI